MPRSIFALDSDDLLFPGVLSAMADLLESTPEAAVCFGDYAEIGESELIRAVPPTLDPYRLCYTNEYPAASLFRRRALEQVGGWRRLIPELDARSDWSLWIALADAGYSAVHLGRGRLVYARRVEPGRLSPQGRRLHRSLYSALRSRHARFFQRVPEFRRASQMSPVRKLLYPAVYGARPRWSVEARPKAFLDRLGIWTLTRSTSDDHRRALNQVLRRAGPRQMPEVSQSSAGKTRSDQRGASLRRDHPVLQRWRVHRGGGGVGG